MKAVLRVLDQVTGVTVPGFYHIKSRLRKA